MSWQMDQLRAQRGRLEEDGYAFEIDGYGYKVWYRDEFIRGGSTDRHRKLHWRTAKKNREQFLKTAVIIAQRHKNEEQDA